MARMLRPMAGARKSLCGVLFPPTLTIRDSRISDLPCQQALEGESRFPDVGFALSASFRGLPTIQEVPYLGAKSTFGEKRGLAQP